MAAFKYLIAITFCACILAIHGADVNENKEKQGAREKKLVHYSYYGSPYAYAAYHPAVYHAPITYHAAPVVAPTVYRHAVYHHAPIIY